MKAHEPITCAQEVIEHWLKKMVELFARPLYAFFRFLSCGGDDSAIALLGQARILMRWE